MATFAIFYNDDDLKPFSDVAQDATLPSGLRATANRYWQAGLNQYATAPLASSDLRVPPSYYQLPNGDPKCRLLVISGNNQVTLAGLIQFLKDVAAANLSNPVWAFMGALAADMANTAINPWPPP